MVQLVSIPLTGFTFPINSITIIFAESCLINGRFGYSFCITQIKEVAQLKTRYNQLVDFSDNDLHNINPELFSSEGFFWIVSASSTAFAMEEMKQYLQEDDEKFQEKLTITTEKLKSSIISGEISAEDQEMIKEIALNNIKQIRDFVNSNCLIFNYKNVTVLAKTIATYWLTNKLIELEFQNVLSEEEMRSVYVFLDTVINDHEEIDAIEKKIKADQELSMDEKVYLRGSWQRGLYFWGRLYQEMYLLSEKIIPFQKNLS